MPVKDTALTTVEHVADALGVPDAKRDHLLIPVIDSATDWIEGQTDRKLKARNYNGFGTAFEHKETGTGDEVQSEDFLHFDGDEVGTDGHGRGRFYLDNFPIVTVDPNTATLRNRVRHPNAIDFVMEKLQDRGSTVTGNETWEALVQFDDYILNQEAGVVLLIGQGIRRGLRNYRFTFTGGFSVARTKATDEPYAPDDLESLCIYISSKLYTDNTDVTQERAGSFSKTFIKLSEDSYVNSIIMRYRRLDVL